MANGIILIAKTKSESYDILGVVWDWVKYTSPLSYEYISEEVAQNYINKLGLVEVARNKNAVLYDTEQRDFHKTFKGFFEKRKIVEQRVREARALAAIKNRI